MKGRIGGGMGVVKINMLKEIFPFKKLKVNLPSILIEWDQDTIFLPINFIDLKTKCVN